MKAILLALCLLCVLPAHADDVLDRKQYFDISAQALSTALVEFAKQAKVQVSADGELLRRYQSPQVKGTESARAALTKLLADSGLGYRVVQDTVQIQPTAQGGGAGSMAAQAPAARQASATTSSADAGREVIDEVIVTAQKRSERLQDVPISISVLTGQELDRTTAQGMLETLNRTPGVASYGGDRTQIAVRGVTAGGVTSSAGANTVAYYLDAVPFGLARMSIVPDVDAYDIERVEVLRGPQGTLYGANAQNGVIRILTKEADTEELEFKTRAAFSSTEDGGENFRGDAAVNIPIVEGKLAVRGTVSYQDLSGWIDKPNKEDVNDAEIRMGRFKLTARPTDALSVDLSAWMSQADYGAPSNSDDDRRHASLIDEPMSDDYDLYGLKIGYDFSVFSITSTTGYLDYEHTDVRDFRPTLFATLPVTRLASIMDADTFSQEVVLAADADSAWQWTLGGMYRDSEDRFAQNSLSGGIPFDFTQGSESYAIFGEVERRVLDGKLGLRAGLRYFNDDTFINENVNQGPPGSAPIYSEASFDATTPRVVVTWYPNREFTLYGSYSEGFRSGFPQNPSVARGFPDFPSLEPDELNNYEVGLKTTLLSGRLSIESAAFFIDWEGTQQALSVAFGGTTIAAQVNSQSASGPGFEFALNARPTDRLGFGASFGWNDLTFDEDVQSRGIILFPKGGRLNASPEYTAGLSADYRFPFGEGGLEGRLSASGNYVSERLDRFLIGSAVAIAESDSITVTRASFGVDADRWSATLFVDNLNNEKGASIVSVLSPTYWATRVRPRTFGLQVEFHL